MKKMRVCAVVMCILMAAALCCCGVKGKLSDKYLVGYNFGERGNSDNDKPGQNIMEVRICYDGTVDILLKSSNAPDYDFAGNYSLTADEIGRLTEAINPSRLYSLDPQENGGVSDGNNKILYVYDKEGSVLKRCGGYMPRNEEFLEMYKTVQEVLHYEEQTQIYDEWLEKKR